MLILFLWLGLFAVFFGSYGTYFVYLRLRANGDWNLKKDMHFVPPITVLLPVHDEENCIKKKLDNILKATYSYGKMEIILIDDASTDRTLAEAEDFLQNHTDLDVTILKQNPRMGKAHALNKGLQVSSNDIIIVSDADALWPPDILDKAMPYLSDPRVGAITGHQVADGDGQSWAANVEKNYLGLMLVLRLGESKIHSTIRFEGVFCAFKRDAFNEFDVQTGADDSGTALEAIQNGFRAILVPEIAVRSAVPETLAKRTKTKIRRATQLTGLWSRCLSLLLNRKLILPKRIALPEIFLSLFAPFVFVSLVIVTPLLVISDPFFFVIVIATLFVLVLIPKTRRYLVQVILDQFVLFYSIILRAGKKRFIAWEK